MSESQCHKSHLLHGDLVFIFLTAHWVSPIFSSRLDVYRSVILHLALSHSLSGDLLHLKPPELWLLSEPLQVLFSLQDDIHLLANPPLLQQIESRLVFHAPDALVEIRQRIFYLVNLALLSLDQLLEVLGAIVNPLRCQKQLPLLNSVYQQVVPVPLDFLVSQGVQV